MSGKYTSEKRYTLNPNDGSRLLRPLPSGSQVEIPISIKKDSPFASVHIYNHTANMSASWSVQTSNFRRGDVLDGQSEPDLPLTGSQFNGYWFPEVGLSGSITGSVGTVAVANIRDHGSKFARLLLTGITANGTGSFPVHGVE